MRSYKQGTTTSRRRISDFYTQFRHLAEEFADVMEASRLDNDMVIHDKATRHHVNQALASLKDLLQTIDMADTTDEYYDVRDFKSFNKKAYANRIELDVTMFETLSEIDQPTDTDFKTVLDDFIKKAQRSIEKSGLFGIIKSDAKEQIYKFTYVTNLDELDRRLERFLDWATENRIYIKVD